MVRKRLRPGDIVGFWWSASYVHTAHFVRWHVMRMHTGGTDTNKLGVGVVVESSWLFSAVTVRKPPPGCVRGQYILRPYTQLFPSYDDAWKRENVIERPTVAQVRRQQRRFPVTRRLLTPRKLRQPKGYTEQHFHTYRPGVR
jgi:hypothetical protein